MNKKTIAFIDYLEELYPNASCELHYKNALELLIAVMLSAQTTDKAVNKVTDAFYRDFSNIKDLSNLSVDEIESYIKRLGLYKKKSVNIYNIVKIINDEFNGVVPNNYEDLVKLPGVGRKTANVVLAEYFNVPRIAVDTHVDRISKRLKYAKTDDSVLQVEMNLMKQLPREKWIKMHHQMIFFGRYFCKAQNPNCTECKMTSYCSYYKGQSKLK